MDNKKKFKQKGGALTLDSSAINIKKIKEAPYNILLKVSMFHYFCESLLLNNILALLTKNENNFTRKMEEINSFHLDTTKLSSKTLKENERELEILSEFDYEFESIGDLNESEFYLSPFNKFHKYQYIVSLVGTIMMITIPENILRYKDILTIESLNTNSVESLLGESEFLIPKYEILRYILNPLHELAESILGKTEYADTGSHVEDSLFRSEYDPKESPLSFVASLPTNNPAFMRGQVDSNKDKEFWSKYFDTKYVNVFKSALDQFNQEIMKPFAEDIIPKLKEIYEKNPSLETAKLIAILGVPSKPYKYVLNPLPNPSLKQTDEEKIILKPLIELLTNIESNYEKFLNQMFINRFKKIIKDNPELKIYELVDFNVKIKTLTGTIKEIETNNNELVLHFKERVSHMFQKRMEEFDLVHSRLGVMDDMRTISDYGLREGSELTFVFKISSGFKPFYDIRVT